jgi:hypothetical protein
MDFDKLLEPYNDNGRTIAIQIKWLLKNGLPQDAVDYAMSNVYKRVEAGEIFENGHELDQELRRVAKDHYEADLAESMKKRVGAIEANLDADWNKLSPSRKIWEVIRGRA